MAVDKNWYWALRDEQRNKTYFGFTKKQTEILKKIIFAFDESSWSSRAPFVNNWNAVRKEK